jgi:hypothetical protein
MIHGDRSGDGRDCVGAADVVGYPSDGLRTRRGRIDVADLRAAVDYHGIAVVDFKERKK